MTATEFSHQEKENKPLLIIGDLITDRTIYCKVPKISPEAPVPVAMIEPNGIVETAGGAGLAASFAVKNNIPIKFVTYTDLLSKTKNILDGIETNIFFTENGNVRKTRYVDVESNYHLLRADTDNMVEYINPESVPFKNFWDEAIFEQIVLHQVSGIVLLDYCKGMLGNRDLLQDLISIAKEQNIPVYVDSRSPDLSKFMSANIIKVNKKELEVASNALNISSLSPEKMLASRLNIEHLIVTNGKDGAAIFKGEEGSHTIKYQPNLSKFSGAPDVTGCGDVFDVTFCYNWCINKLNVVKSLQISVDAATKFAYEPIEERLHVNTKRKDK